MSTNDLASTSEQDVAAAPAAVEASTDDLLPRFETPIVPKGTIAGRALVAVVAIMTFLASLTTGAVMLVRSAANDWQSEVAREVTIQVRPAGGRDIEADVARAAAVARGVPGVAEVRPYSKEESARLLEPWLGTGLRSERVAGAAHHRGADHPGRHARPLQLRAVLGAQVPVATLDDHRGFVERMRAMAAGGGYRRIGCARPRACRHHAVGDLRDPRRHRDQPAGDRGAPSHRRQEQFHRQAFPAALPRPRPAGRPDRWRRRHRAVRAGRSCQPPLLGSAAGDQFSALFGTFSIGILGYAAVLVQIVLIALVTAVASRHTVNRTLETIQ